MQQDPSQPWGGTQSVSKANGEESKTFDISAALVGDDDKIATILVYQTAAGGGYVKNPSVTITYSTGTVYTVSFNESHSAPATVKIGDTDVTAGTSLPNGTYDFTATAVGYENYAGSFTVSGANKVVNYSMTPKTPVKSITLKYKYDGSVIDTKNNSVTGLYVDDSYTYAYQKYWANGGNLYVMDASNTRANLTLKEDNEITVNYNLSQTGNFYFYEFDGGYTTRADAESNGSAAKSSASFTIPEDGLYIITANCYGSATNRSATIKHGDVLLATSPELSIYAGGTTFATNLTALNEDDEITIKTSSGADGIDYVILQKITTVAATVGANGYTTFASTYPLDLTDAKRPAGLKAYKATLDGKNLTFTKLNQKVPAGTGLLLLGETKGSTYNIPVAASGDAITTDFTGVTAPTALHSVTDVTYYFVMKKAAGAESPLEFAPLSTSDVTIPAGKAYITVPNSAFTGGGSSARALDISFDDEETTGINAVNGEGLTVNGSFFDLQGRRVAQPTKGLYIVNGKKVVIK